MAITSTTQNVSSLTINKVPSASVYKKMKDQNLINENELYVVSGSEIDKYTFTATAGQSTFTIPFEFDGGSSLTIYYNGVMMQEDENYTISGNDITLKDWTTEEGDTITVMGIEGAAAIDFAKDYDKYSAMLDAKATEAVSSITATGDGYKSELASATTSAKSELNTIVSDGTQQVQDLVDTLPDNWENTVFKDQANTFGANGKITMDPTYTPTSDNDLITKKYVSENSYKVGDTLTTARTDLGDDWLLCNGAFVDNNIEIYDLLLKEDYSNETYWKTFNVSGQVGTYLSSYFFQFLNGYYLFRYLGSRYRFAYNTEGPDSLNRNEVSSSTNYFLDSCSAVTPIKYLNNYYKPRMEEREIELCKTIVFNTISRIDEYNPVIEKHLKKGWTLDRISLMEKAILYVSIYELNDYTKEIVANQAVELAKKYCDEDAYKFINGVLAVIE